MTDKNFFVEFVFRPMISYSHYNEDLKEFVVHFFPLEDSVVRGFPVSASSCSSAFDIAYDSLSDVLHEDYPEAFAEIIFASAVVVDD